MVKWIFVEELIAHPFAEQIIDCDRLNSEALSGLHRRLKRSYVRRAVNDGRIALLFLAILEQKLSRFLRLYLAQWRERWICHTLNR